MHTGRENGSDYWRKDDRITGKFIIETPILWITVRTNRGLQYLQENDHQNVKNRLAVVK
jgi:hypothetical protein